MATCPFAVQRLLPESATQPSITPRIIIDHTQAGTGSLFDFWQSEGKTLECHLWVGLDGTVEQYMDTAVKADANFEANRWVEGGKGFGAISIETENTRDATNRAYRGGEGAAAFDRDPWSDAQVASLVRLHDWLADTHPTIRRQKCDDPKGSGLGYHSMWGTGPTPWIPKSSRGKKCPGDARIAQHKTILLPAFTSGTTPNPGELTMDAEAKAAFAALNKRLDEQEAKIEEARRLAGSAVGWSKAHASDNGITSKQAGSFDPTN